MCFSIPFTIFPIKLLSKITCIILLSIILASCFQTKIRKEKYTITCVEFDPTAIHAINNIDSLLIAGIDSSVFVLSSATKTQLISQLRQQWVDAGYLQTQPAYESWAQLGMKSYNSFMNSFHGQEPLSPSLLKHFLKFNHKAKLLLYINFDTKKNRLNNSFSQYSRVESTSMHYKLWKLSSGQPILDVYVSGYSYQSNEKHRSSQDNSGKALLDDAIHIIVYEGVPEETSISAYVKNTNREFITLINELKSVLATNNANILKPYQNDCDSK